MPVDIFTFGHCIVRPSNNGFVLYIISDINMTSISLQTISSLDKREQCDGPMYIYTMLDIGMGSLQLFAT